MNRLSGFLFRSLGSYSKSFEEIDGSAFSLKTFTTATLKGLFLFSDEFGNSCW